MPGLEEPRPSSFSPPTLDQRGGWIKCWRLKARGALQPLMLLWDAAKPNALRRGGEDPPPPLPTATHCSIAFQWTFGHVGRRLHKKGTDLATSVTPPPIWRTSHDNSKKNIKKKQQKKSMIQELLKAIYENQTAEKYKSSGAKPLKTPD